MILFFFKDAATTEIYTLSLHDALPICCSYLHLGRGNCLTLRHWCADYIQTTPRRSEEHTSELQSRQYLVCRLLLEKKQFIHTFPPKSLMPSFYYNRSNI